MGDSDNPDQIVKRGELYRHSEYGEVKVMGIWRGVQQVDKARNTEEMKSVIIRYLTEEEGMAIEEYTDTLDEFLESIE